VLGTRLADAVVLVMELLGEATFSGRDKKRELLAEANRKIEVVRWLIVFVLILDHFQTKKHIVLDDNSRSGALTIGIGL